MHKKLNSLDLWLINETSLEPITLLSQINKNGNSQIISSALSVNAKYISFSDSENTVLFEYNTFNNNIKKLKTIKNISGKFLFFDLKEENLIILNQQKGKVQIYNIKFSTIVEIELPKNTLILSCDYYNDNISFSTFDKKLVLVNLNNLSLNKNSPCPDALITQIKFLDSERLLLVSDKNM